MADEQLNAVLAEVAKIDDGEFAEYGGGWPGEIGTALVDAVFSIRARYHAKDPTKGVLGRVRKFRSQHPDAAADLRTLSRLGEASIREIMGSTKTSQRLKSECVIEAANALLALVPAVATADQLRGTDSAQIEKAYTSVDGLGWVTCEYFQMLLQKPGVKADTMIVRFVNNALGAAELGPVGDREARQLVVGAHEIQSRGVCLIAYDHAIWRAKGELVIDADPSA